MKYYRHFPISTFYLSFCFRHVNSRHLLHDRETLLNSKFEKSTKENDDDVDLNWTTELNMKTRFDRGREMQVCEYINRT